MKVNEIEIEQTGTMKLLGVSIDERLNFTEHMKNVSTKASQRVRVIFRLRNLIPTETKLLKAIPYSANSELWKGYGEDRGAFPTHSCCLPPRCVQTSPRGF